MPRIASVLLSLGVLLGVAIPAGAQEPKGDGAVEIEFETGDFDGERADWPISVVHVTGGDLDVGQPMTLELKEADGTILWTGTERVTGPTTSFSVIGFVAVRDVARAAVSQVLPEVAGEVSRRQEVEVRQQGAGGGGGGLLALSLVLAVVLVAILFRTPLPSQVSQRWTK